MSLLGHQKRLVPKTPAENAEEKKYIAIAVSLSTAFGVMVLALFLHDAGIIHINLPEKTWSFFMPTAFLIFFVLIMFLGHAHKKRLVRFWNEVANSYGLTYAPSISVKDEPAVMFKQGSLRTGTHVLSGVLHGLPVTIFQYSFAKQEGKHLRVYPYTVYEFLFEGRFPHLYLNYEHNYNPGFFERMQMPHVVLPAEFDKHFTLHVPKQYEIEALTIFTPDTLAFLLDNKWKYDVEMLDNRMLVFGRSNLGSVEFFMKELDRVSELVHHLERKLHSASFAPIGNLPYRL